jgi:hypothetical protein
LLFGRDQLGEKCRLAGEHALLWNSGRRGYHQRTAFDVVTGLIRRRRFAGEAAGAS